jgi:hypothetical protein
MSFQKERVSAEQVRRVLELLRYPYSAIHPMSPPSPDVCVTGSSGPASESPSKLLKSTGESEPVAEAEADERSRWQSELAVRGVVSCRPTRSPISPVRSRPNAASGIASTVARTCGFYSSGDHRRRPCRHGYSVLTSCSSTAGRISSSHARSFPVATCSAS